MSSRYGAARPKRAGENYARTHHGEMATPDSKKVKFDVRNPSNLAPDAEDADDAPDVFLEADADVIRGSAATKRGAVNIDGYDSDSDREELGAARQSAKDDAGGKGRGKGKVADEDVEDMFAADEEEDGDEKDEGVDVTTGKKSKEVKFLDQEQIEGQEGRSRSGGHISIGAPGDVAAGPEEEDSDDEEAVRLAIQEEGIDDEVGLGGLKKHAPKVEAFNLKQEHEEGRFDESGNYVRKAIDPDAVHDRWLEGVSKKDMRKAAEAHEKREVEARQKRREDDELITSDLLGSLISRLERGETSLEALARLGRKVKKDHSKAKKVPAWKLKKQRQKAGEMDVDEVTNDDKDKSSEDPEQVKVKEAIDAITSAADRLLSRDRPEIYDTERELLVREYKRETGEDWVDPPPEEAAEPENKTWEYRWTDGRDDSVQGPYDGAMMKAWQDAGYFGDGIEFREVGDEGGWSRVVNFV